VNRACQLVALGMALMCVALLIAAITVAPARGHDHSRPDLDDWYLSLRTPGGGPCCGGPKVDATTLDDADWETKDGHYRVRVNGQWLDVPDDKVVPGPNRAGRTMVWLFYSNGNPFVRCFMPGAMI
jgi:hypothetical protein